MTTTEHVDTTEAAAPAEPPTLPIRTGRSPVNLRKTCRCGKDGTVYSHGGTDTRKPFSCDEVLAMGVAVMSRWQRITNALRGER